MGTFPSPAGCPGGHSPPIVQHASLRALPPAGIVGVQPVHPLSSLGALRAAWVLRPVLLVLLLSPVKSCHGGWSAVYLLAHSASRVVPAF